MLKRLAFVFFFGLPGLLLTNPAKAQAVEWLKSFPSADQPNYPVVQADSHGCFVLYKPKQVPVVDGLPAPAVVDGITVNHLGNPYLFRVNDTGKATIGKAILSMGVILIATICIDDQSNLYVLGEMTDKGDGSGNVKFGNIQYNTMNGNRFIVKYNKNLVQQWVVQFGKDQGGGSGVNKFVFRDGRLFFFVQRKPNGEFYIGPTVYPVGPSQSILAEINPLNGAFKWSQQVKGVALENMAIVGNDLYVSGRYYNTILGTDTLSNFGSVLARYSDSGVYKQCIFLAFPSFVSYGVGFSTLTGDGKYLNIAGNFTDTTVFVTDTLFPQMPVTESEPFFASLTKDLQLRWTYNPREIRDSAYNGSQTNSGQLLSSFSSFGFSYFGGYITDPIDFQGMTLGYHSSSVVHYGFFVLKMDSMGNILWLTGDNNHGNLNSIHGVPARGVYLAGSANHNDPVHIGSGLLNPFSGGFLGKLGDFSITRGEVYAGPYCAGDTIDIPYTFEGMFDTSNYFVAELSDENGNFTGRQRELGRLKSMIEDTIKGLLPLFEVASSANYRIRIRSTSPEVQSYYKKDSLRLLVFSRDSADAGADVTICAGERVSLKTFGGTKWNWSPGLWLNDSTLREPLATPEITTLYRVAISDSSGCGVTDTAYKTIFVRPHLHLSVDFSDTLTCVNPLVIRAGLSGGDSNHYKVSWFHKKGTNITLIKSAAITGNKDTLNIADPFDDVPGRIYYVILSDSCSLVPDTVFLSNPLPSYTPLNVQTSLADTQLCHGNEVNVAAFISGGSGRNYQNSWLDSNSVLLDTGAGYRFVAAHSGRNLQPETYTVKAVLSDGCMPAQDTATFTWTVKPPLKAMILNGVNEVNDTTLCYGQDIGLSSNGSGGQGGDYHYQWRLNGEDYSKNENIFFNSHLLYDSLIGSGQKSAKIRLVLGDNCTGIDDSSEFELSILPPLNAGIQALDSLCYGTDTAFYATFSGGRNAAYTYTWLLNGSALSSDSLFNFVHSGRTGGQELIFVLEDGCSAPAGSDSLNFHILEPLSVEIKTVKPCADPEIELSAITQGGKTSAYELSWFDEDHVAIGSSSPFVYKPLKPVKLYVNLSDNCSKSEAGDTISVYPRPEVSVILSDTAACDPLELEIEIDRLTQTDNLYSLFSGSTFLDSFRTDPYTRTMNAGSFAYRLEIQSEGPCKKMIPLSKVEVYPLPKAEFAWNPSKPTWDNKEVSLVNLSTGGSRYEWDIENMGFFTGFEPGLPITDSGSYFIILKVISEYDCEDTAGRTLHILPTLTLFVPNVFTPNSDGHNQLFTISGTGYQSYTIQVFNRWGQVVFSGDQGSQWDGTFMGRPVPEGAYSYIINLVDKENNFKMYSGMVTVLR